MFIENLSEEPEEVLDITSKAGYLKVNTELGEIKLNSYNSVEIQPYGTILGTNIKVEENGNIAPMITFDTKKLQQPKKEIDAKQMLDDAIREYLNDQEI